MHIRTSETNLLTPSLAKKIGKIPLFSAGFKNIYWHTVEF